MNVSTRLRRLFGPLLGLDERRCVFCREPFVPDVEGPAASRMLCAPCRSRLSRRDAGFCPFCGEPSELDDAPVMPCGDCLQTLPPWEEFLFYGVYEGDQREALLKGKFSGNFAALDLMGGLLAEVCAEHYVCAPKPQLIVPIPLHVSRLRERGFNQSLELARHVGRLLDLPVRYDLLTRVRATVPQASLDREQRRNLIQPFAASGEVRSRHVLLVDDVCTTGATLSCATRCLLEAGAARVDVAVAARTSRYSVRNADEEE